MAVDKPAPRPVSIPPRRVSAAPAQAPNPGTVRVGKNIGERRALAAQPRTVQDSAPRGALQKRAQDVYAHRAAPQRPVHVANAKYSTGPRPQSPLKAITKDLPNSSSGGLPSHHDAVAFLDGFLARVGKIRSKP